MAGIVLRPRARRDLDDIWDYTVKTFIFYRTLPDLIEVVRILHQSMDFEQHM